MTEKRKILSVSFSYYKTDARTLNLLTILNKLGFEIHLICFADFVDITKCEIESNIKQELKVEFTIYPVELSVFMDKSLNSYKKLLYFNDFVNKNYIRELKKDIKNDLKNDLKTNHQAFEYIIANDLYALPSAAKLFKYIKQISNSCKLIYDSREVYSQISTLNNKKLKQIVLTQIEKFYVKNVNSIITSGRLDTEYLKTHFAKTNKELEYFEIYNYPPFIDIESLDKNKLRDKYNIPKDKIVILYQGKIMKNRGLDLILDVLEELENSDLYKSKIHFCLMGEGELESEIKSKSQQKSLTNITFCGFVNYSELMEYTVGADWGLVLFEPVSVSYDFSLPNKLFEFIMAEVPVITNELPAIKEVIDKYNCGKLIAKKFTKDDLYECIIEIIKERKIFEEINLADEKSINKKTNKVNLLAAKQEYNYNKQEELIKHIFQ